MSTMVAGPGPAYYESGRQIVPDVPSDSNSDTSAPPDTTANGGEIVVPDYCPGQYTTPPPIPATQSYCSMGSEFYPNETYYPGPPIPDYCQHHTMCAIHGVPGPATVRMVSTNSNPPIPLPVQVPAGHIVQQIVDESGTLQHVILSTQPMPMSLCPYTPNANQGPHQFYSAPGPPPPQGYMPSFQPPPHYNSPVMSPPLAQTSPPPHNFLKHEGRNPRHEKIRGKFPIRPPHNVSQNQTSSHLLKKQNNLTNSQPSLSPKKEILKKNGKDDHINGTGTPDPHVILSQLLSRVEAPEASDISATSAFVRWKPPDISTCPPEATVDGNIRYEVFLSNKFQASTDKTHIALSNLKPATEYRVYFVCTCNAVRGQLSPHHSFYTKASKPDTPLPPKLIERTKNSLFFRWLYPKDNGSKISSVNLEILGGDYTTWTEVCVCRNKQYNILKLKPQTSYRIRIVAVNDIGKSEYSSEITESTSGLAPSQPVPPSLASSSVNSLCLQWNKRPEDETFTLQMDDPFTGFGFRPVFNGRETRHTCSNLERNSDYKFRICSQNTVGNSPFSSIACYRTSPDKPTPPYAVTMKGKPSSETITVTWYEPSDHGGTPVNNYELEIDKGKGYEKVYSGSNMECTLTGLTAGQSYKVRCRAESTGGKSIWSEEAVITTKPIVPSQCQPPSLSGKPKATTAQLVWVNPISNGGSPVLEFNLEVVTSDSEKRMAYCGRDTECLVAGLLPGRSYVFMLRAVNKVGPGAWSKPLEMVSGAGPPVAPKIPLLKIIDPYSVEASWEEPINNGASIESYSLQSAQRTMHEEETSEDVTPNLNYLDTFRGLNTKTTCKNLVPASGYWMRVHATNSAGPGNWSLPAYIATPAYVPAQVSNVSSEANSEEITLSWAEPACHGEPIMHYEIEVADRVITTTGPALQHSVNELEPETVYKIRIKAVNSVGRGPASTVHKVSTTSLPPLPPTIELLKASHNSLRLKWGDGRNNQLLKYYLYMESLSVHKNMEFYQVYSGTNEWYKITKLDESSSYRFKIRASNDAGIGPYSDAFEFTTSKAPPPPLKSPKVSERQSGTCCIEWSPVRCHGDDQILYKLQMMQIGKENDYVQIYNGPELSHIVSVEPERSFYVRVCAIRLCSDGQVMVGAYSTPSFFSTPKQPVVKPCPAPQAQQQVRKLEWSTLNDHEKTFAMVLLFFVLAVVAAYFVSPSPNSQSL